MSSHPLSTAPRAGPVRLHHTDRPRTNLFDRWLLAKLARSFAPAPIRFRLWDGTETSPSHAPPAGTVVLKDRRALFGLVRDAELMFGEGYTEGRVEVLGNFVGVLEAAIRATQAAPLRRHGRRPPGPGSSRENIFHHYDVGNDFYELWLDREMVYTCAYFDSPDASLEQAQTAKMEYVCRKVGLRPGMNVFEAGCGWGALALHMARRHGVTVKACNVSREQIRWARKRAMEEGLADRVEFLEEDYRAIRGTFDVFVSVGMLEHVGPENYGTLGEVIDRSLTPAGRGLIHFIGRDRPDPLNAWMQKRIFPGAYPPTVAEVLEKVFEPRRFSALDIENLRLHYARTAREWRLRFEAAAERVASGLGERFVRAWRLYLAGTEAAFTAGSLQLFQIVFARSGENGVPWTRAPLYAPGASADGNR